MTAGESFYCGLDECVRNGWPDGRTLFALGVFVVLGWIGSRWVR